MKNSRLIKYTQAGFTLLEVIISASIFVVVIALITYSLYNANEESLRQNTYNQLNIDLEATAEKITRLVQGAKFIYNNDHQVTLDNEGDLTLVPANTSAPHVLMLVPNLNIQTNYDLVLIERSILRDQFQQPKIDPLTQDPIQTVQETRWRGENANGFNIPLEEEFINNRILIKPQINTFAWSDSSSNVITSTITYHWSAFGTVFAYSGDPDYKVFMEMRARRSYKADKWVEASFKTEVFPRNMEILTDTSSQ